MCTNLTSEMDVRAYVPKIAAWLNTLMRMAMAVSMAGWYPDPEYASSHACWDVHVYALSNWTMDTLNWSATWMLPMFLQPLKIYAVLTLKIDFIKCVRRAQKKKQTTRTMVISVSGVSMFRFSFEFMKLIYRKKNSAFCCCCLLN